MYIAPCVYIPAGGLVNVAFGNVIGSVDCTKSTSLPESELRTIIQPALVKLDCILFVGVEGSLVHKYNL